MIFSLFFKTLQFLNFSLLNMYYLHIFKKSIFSVKKNRDSLMIDLNPQSLGGEKDESHQAHSETDEPVLTHTVQSCSLQHGRCFSR